MKDCSNMDLYNFSNNKLAQIERQDFALEKEMKTLLNPMYELFNSIYFIRIPN